MNKTKTPKRREIIAEEEFLRRNPEGAEANTRNGQASPLPWQNCRDGIYSDTHDGLCIVEARHISGKSIEQGCANAALIVRSVNNAPKLVNDLRHLEAFCQKQCDVDSDESLLWAQCVSIAGAALSDWKASQ